MDVRTQRLHLCRQVVGRQVLAGHKCLHEGATRNGRPAAGGAHPRENHHDLVHEHLSALVNAGGWGSAAAWVPPPAAQLLAGDAVDQILVAGVRCQAAPPDIGPSLMLLVSLEGG